MNERKEIAITAPPPEASVEEIAEYLVAIVDQMEGLVPNFQLYDGSQVRRIAAAARYANKLVPQIITTMEAFLPAIEVKIFDVESAKAALRYSAAMKLFAQRLSVFLDGVQFTIDTELAKAGTQALATYGWAKLHAKSPEGVALRPYVHEMGRAIKKTMNRRKRVASASEAVEATTDGDLPEETLEPTT